MIEPIDLIEDVLDAAKDGKLEASEAKEITARVVDAALKKVDLAEIFVEVAQRVGEFLSADRPARLRKRAARKRSKAEKLEAKAETLESV